MIQMDIFNKLNQKKCTDLLQVRACELPWSDPIIGCPQNRQMSGILFLSYIMIYWAQETNIEI